MYICAHVCTYVWKQKDSLGCYFADLSTLFFIQSLSGGLKLTQLTRLAGESAPGICQSLLPVLRL